MPDALTIIHVITPGLLLPFILFLIPPLPEPTEAPPGVTPITIRTITPRRGLILTVLILLTATYFFNSSVLIADLVTASHPSGHGWADDWHLTGWALVFELIYAFGCFVIWGGVTLLCEWRRRYGGVALVLLSVANGGMEVPNLVLSVLKEVHDTVDSHRIFSILAIPPSCLRLLLLPILLAAIAYPNVRFESADETTGLLSGDPPVNGGDSPADAAREAYGTFNEGNGGAAAPAKPASTPTSTDQGAKTPAKQDSKQKLRIPKQLGERQEEDKPLSWSEMWPKIRKLSPYLWPSTSRKLQLYSLLCLILLTLGRFLQPIAPLLLGEIVRRLSGSGLSVWPPFIAWISIRTLMSNGGVLSFLQQSLWVQVSQYTDREMMLLCFNHLLNLSLAFHTKRNTGEVLKIIDRGSAINNLFQTLIFTAIPVVIDIFIAFGVFFYFYGGLLASETMVIMALYIYVSVAMTQRRTAIRRQLRDRDIKQRGIVSDVLTNWESVKYFTAEHRETSRFRTAILSYQETERRWTIEYQLLNLTQMFLLSLGLLFGALIICLRVLRGQADAAEFVVFIQYFQQLSSPLNQLGWLYRQLNQNTTDAEKMFSLLAQATDVNDKPDAKDLVVTDGVIEFDDVHFSYDGKVEALKGVSFKIGKGQKMALVGESGSGKSTILRLLYRFYDLTSGHIYIDGQDISNVTQLSLRRAIGIVPQDSVLWNDTIGANISYGKEGATDEEIVAAAQAAQLHDRILSFPDQYSTMVGERGIRLSGGEKQRVSLARMFLKSPTILVLDEATSALDTETERGIQRGLADLARGRSSLSIAHRLSTIINSDEIVVMKDGMVIEHGAYKDLLEREGVFADMCVHFLQLHSPG